MHITKSQKPQTTETYILRNSQCTNEYRDGQRDRHGDNVANGLKWNTVRDNNINMQQQHKTDMNKGNNVTKR